MYPNFKTTSIVNIFHMSCPVWLNLYWVCQSSRGIEQNRGRRGRGGSGWNLCHRLQLTGSPLHAHLMHNLSGKRDPYYSNLNIFSKSLNFLSKRICNLTKPIILLESGCISFPCSHPVPGHCILVPGSTHHCCCLGGQFKPLPKLLQKLPQLLVTVLEKEGR